MIYIKQGDSETLSVGPIETCDNKPVDLSAATVKMIIKQNMETPDDEAVFAQDIVHPNSDTLAFLMSAAESASIEPGDYIVGVKIVWDDGTAREIARDKVVVSQGVFND